MVVLFGIVKTTISNKRLVVNFIAVAGQLEVMAYSPQNLAEWSKQSDETANIEDYRTVCSYVTHQQLCIVFVLSLFCLFVLFLHFYYCTREQTFYIHQQRSLALCIVLVSFTTFNSSLSISCFAIVVKIYMIYHGSMHIARHVIAVQTAKSVLLI